MIGSASLRGVGCWGCAVDPVSGVLSCGEKDLELAAIDLFVLFTDRRYNETNATSICAADRAIVESGSTSYTKTVFRVVHLPVERR